MTRVCSGCGLRSCDGRCYDESPDGTMCARCNDQPAIEGETLCIYCRRTPDAEYAELTEQVASELRFTIELQKPRRAA